MPLLISMCGSPFSGKTTLAKRIASATGSRYLSLDDLMRARGIDLSQSQSVEEWERAHHACFRLTAAALQAGESVVIDDTNYMRWLRGRFRAIAAQHNCSVVTVYLDVPLDELERRRQTVCVTGERNTLADDAFYAVVNGMEILSEDESESPHPRRRQAWDDAHRPGRRVVDTRDQPCDLEWFGHAHQVTSSRRPLV